MVEFHGSLVNSALAGEILRSFPSRSIKRTSLSVRWHGGQDSVATSFHPPCKQSIFLQDEFCRSFLFPLVCVDRLGQGSCDVTHVGFHMDRVQLEKNRIPSAASLTVKGAGIPHWTSFFRHGLIFS